MKDGGTSESLFECAYTDGRQAELVLPRDTVARSATGGTQEALDFLRYLEAAKETIECSPAIKVAFGEQLSPLVLDIACRRLTPVIIKTLLELLANMAENDVAGIRDCQRYPYLKILSESPKPTLKIVAEAFSIEPMVSEVKKLVRPAVEFGLPAAETGGWAISHILAWSLHDIAHDKRLRRKVAGLGPAEADKLIWDHAWDGPHYNDRFVCAAEMLGDEVALFILEVLDLPRRTIQELESLIGLRSSSYYLTVAATATRAKHPVLDWVTTKYAGLDSSHALAVAETARELNWQETEDESARRRLVIQESLRKRRDVVLTVLGFVGGIPGSSGPSANDWLKCGDQALIVGQDFITRAPEFPRAGVSFGPANFDTIDSLISLERAIRESDLSLDAQRILYARIQGYSRDEASMAVHISKNRVSAAWKELNRRKGHFCRTLR